jgi:hypothetical protein
MTYRLILTAFSLMFIAGCAWDGMLLDSGPDTYANGMCAEWVMGPEQTTPEAYETVQRVCSPTDGTCLEKLCLEVQSVAVGPTYEPNPSDHPAIQMNRYVESFLGEILTQYEESWGYAIRHDLGFQYRMNLLTSTAEKAHTQWMSQRLSSFKASIQAVQNPRQREILISMFTVVQRLSEQVLQPTGALRDFQRNVTQKLNTYRDLRTRLSFT